MKTYTTNQLAVSDKAVQEIENFTDHLDYDGLSTKDIIKTELKNAEYFGNKGNLQKQVKDLVYGGYFRVYNHDIMEFLETLNLNDFTMKRATEDPLQVYSEVLYHAIKRLIKGEGE